jgi:hypothetical protein
VFCEDFKDFHPRWNILFKGKHKKRTMERFRLNFSEEASKSLEIEIGRI